MDAKIDAIHGAKGSEDPVREILKVVRELQGTVNGVYIKLDQALQRISVLERTIRSYSKHQDHGRRHSSPMKSMPTEGDSKEPCYPAVEVEGDSKCIDLTKGQPVSTDKLSSPGKDNASHDSQENSSDCQSIARSTFEKKETKGSSSNFGRDGLENSSNCQEIDPSKVAHRFRPRKVNRKLRSPIMKLRINTRKLENKGLSREEAVCVHYVQQYCHASPRTVLVHIGAYNAWVTAKELKCLTYDKSKDGTRKWLDDHVVEAYSKLIMHQYASKVNAKQFFVWSVQNCSIMATITSRNLPTNRAEMALSLTENDRVYFPMVVKRGRAKHWVLLVKNNDRKMFQVLDSLWELTTYRDQIDKMIMGINAILGKSTTKDDVLSWDVIQEEDIPKQQDGCSCGLYVLKFIEFWNGFYMPEGFEEEDIHSFRLRVLVELLLAGLNDIDEVKREIRSLK